MGTDEYLKYLQSETPGELETSYTEDVDKYIKEAKKANDEKKKQHFGMSFENPLKGFPYNEQFGFDKNLMEIEEDLAAIELEESNPDAALKNKAEKSGMPLGILKKVFKRGVAAWRTGHRPGTNPTQWGLARVNSFVTKSKGTWGGADQDLAKKVQGKSEEIEENYKDVIKMYPRDREWKKLITKHKRHIDAFRNEKRQKDLPKRVEDEILDWAIDAGEISNKGEVEDFIQSILDEGFKSDAQRRAAFASGYKAKGKKGKKEDIDLDEGKMGQLLMDIQQGATAKELAKSYKIPLSVAKDFLKDYYMNKRNNRKAYESVMDSYRNMIVEKKEMNPKVIEKIAKLTDRNDHNESLLLLAKELKDREAIKLLGSIKDMHKVYGHMPKELIDLRNKVFDNLMRQSKSKYANHSDVYGAL